MTDPITPEAFAEILRLHAMWVRDEPGGKRANLRGADLAGADLAGATINWRSHDLVSRILLNAARDDARRRMLAGLILISRDWCWPAFLALVGGQVTQDEADWCLATLAPYVRDEDDAPDQLRNAAAAQAREARRG